MPKLSSDEKTLLEMLRYMRPSGSPTEQLFIDRFLKPVGFKEDMFKNLTLTIGDSPVLFSSHVDTVHKKHGMQNLSYQNGIVSLSKRDIKGGSSCLGADDTAGIWLMLEMIKAGVEGTYIIHHGEEIGCIGSSNLAFSNPEWLMQFDYAIAFDRAGFADVITHQAGSQCCSQKFAQALANNLGRYKPSPLGVYTDTAEYAHIIPECTNISVGYNHQHTTRETQSMPFLIALRDSLIATDWQGLPVERIPEETSSVDYNDTYDDFYYSSNNFMTLSSLVSSYPDVAADILEGVGYTAHSFLEEASKINSVINYRKALI